MQYSQHTKEKSIKYNSYSVGDTYGNYLFTKIVPIEEICSTLIELEHIPSKATILHIAREDPENLFCLSFQTLPSSNDGIAHILEHIVLCGSKHFPVKDPFFSMHRRSLATFMNALTGSDFTCYPASSQLEKDFYNLLEVYIDAVFYPLITPESFSQEGHRLTIDNNNALQIEGVVFNEMKGSMSRVETRLWHFIMQHLLCDTPYRYDSGGTPEEIPHLTREQLIAFHKKYYDPSRCLFFFYGDIPIEKHLQYLEEKILHAASPRTPLPIVPKQKQHPKSKYLEGTFPVQKNESLDRQSYIAFTWLTMPIQNQEDLLGLSIIDSIFMSTDASLLCHALLQSGSCRQAYSEMDGEMSEIPYIIICRGCDIKDRDTLEKIVFSTITKAIQTGFKKSDIDTALHQLEIERTEINRGFGPFGLNLFMRAGLLKQHGCAPEIGIKIHELFTNLLEKVKDPSYLPTIAKKYLLENKYYLCTTFAPDSHLEAREIAAEKAFLHKIEKQMNREDYDKLRQNAIELEQYHKKMKQQDISCLPTITTDDIPKNPTDFPLYCEKIGNIELFCHYNFTNHFIYFNYTFSLPSLPVTMFPYLSLFTGLLTALGTEGKSYKKQLKEIEAYTGGIEAGIAIYAPIKNPNLLEPTFNIRGKCLFRNRCKALSLCKEFVTASRFDEKDRIQEVVLQIYTELRQHVQSHPLSFATLDALSPLSDIMFLQERMQGISYYHTIQAIATSFSTQADDLYQHLYQLQKGVLHGCDPDVILSIDKSDYQIFQKELLMQSWPSKKFTSWNPFEKRQKDYRHFGRIVASQVAYNVFAMTTISDNHPDMPLIHLATKIMENTTLHPLVREQGGAYGSGAVVNGALGIFYFYSFRDPNIAKTASAFITTLQNISEQKFTQKDITEATLTLIQKFDTPVSPAIKAEIAYGWKRTGKDFAFRKKYRDTILSAWASEIARVVKTHLLPQIENGIFVSYAGQSLLEQSCSPLSDLGISMVIKNLSETD